MTPGRAWQVASVAFLALCAFALVESLQLSLGGPLGPGPGFFPFWLGLIGGVLAVALLVQVSLGRAEIPRTIVVPERPAARRVGLVLLGLGGAAALLEPLGFRLTLALFNVYLLTGLGVRNPWVTAVFALAGSFGVFYVFYQWLKVPLPIGALGL